MQNSNINQGQFLYPQAHQANPNAVSINIIAPQAYADGNTKLSPQNGQDFYSLYGQNPIPNQIFPQNYNNLINSQVPDRTNNKNYDNSANAMANAPLQSKTDNPEDIKKTSDDEEKTKQVVPLTNEYIQSLENYMNDDNPKVRLIGAKELMERFKEDENRKDNPSLIPLLNKALKDTSPSIRFLALTTLQLGYSVGNDETVQLLKDIQATNKDKFGEDSLLASEILLNMSEAQKVDVPMTENEIRQSEKNKDRKNSDDEKVKEPKVSNIENNLNTNTNNNSEDSTNNVMANNITEKQENNQNKE